MNMNKNLFHCRIAEDLMPVYSEGLCSQESQEFMKQHLATCENCRKLFEQMPISEMTPRVTPDEKKPFFKIQKKFRRNKFQIIFLSILSGILLAGIGYFSYGQATRQTGMQSFETVWQSIEAKKFAKYIASGKFDNYLQTASLRTDFNIYNLNYQDAFFEEAKKNLEQTYQDAFGSTSLKRIEIKTSYCETVIASENVPVSDIHVIYQDGQEINLCLIRNMDGKFIVNPSYLASDNTMSKEAVAFRNCLSYISYAENGIIGLTERTLQTANNSDEEKLQIKSHIATLRFAPEYRENLEKSFLAFYQQGYFINTCYFSELRYDEEKKLLYHLATVTAQDDKGSATLLTRVYSDYNGLIPPSKDMGEIYTDNCTEKLAENLLLLFG